jgi:hypothetical protein
MVIKSTRMRWAGQVALIGETTRVQWKKKLNVRGQLGDLDENGSTLKSVLKK